MTARIPLPHDVLADTIMNLFASNIDDDTQFGIDETVHDRARNNDQIDTEGETDPDIITDLRSHEASSINNHGPREQIRMLSLWGMENAEIIDLFLDDPGLSQHARMRLKEIAERGR